jgi:hypothetical protein
MVSTAPAVLVLGAAVGMSLAAISLMPVVGAQPAAFAIDDRGFIDTAARCEEPSIAVAFGRTQQALVAICRNGPGVYEYRGVRLSDDALLTLAAGTNADGQFVAANDGVTYTFSAKELVVTSHEEVIHREPMVAYVEPRLGG